MVMNKSSLLWQYPVMEGSITSEKLPILNDPGLESPPTEEELSLLIDGYEQRILSAVLARLGTSFTPQFLQG
jgi:hypothetical protein